MKKQFIIGMILGIFIGMAIGIPVGYTASQDIRISDNDGNILDINADGSLTIN